MVIKVLFASLMIPLMACAADDDWAKVRAIRSGTELKIYKIGARQPILAKLDEANDETLIIVLKNEQTAIPRSQIERIDYRPPHSGSRMKSETKSETEVPGSKAPTPGPQRPPGPSSSVSSNVNIGKPDFEVVYRRKSGAPKQ